MEELASRDERTKTLNRRSMLAILEQHLSAAGTHGQSFCVALLDLDLFGSINDGYGHLVGDQVLEAFAGLVLSTMRASDSFGRYGGSAPPPSSRTSSSTGSASASPRSTGTASPRA